MFAGIFADEEHLPDVRFGLGVHLEAILVAALLFACLAVPSEALEPFGLELVVEVFGTANFCFRHYCDLFRKAIVWVVIEQLPYVRFRLMTKQVWRRWKSHLTGLCFIPAFKEIKNYAR